MESGGESDPPPDPSKSISILNLCLSFTCLCVYLRVSLPSFYFIGAAHKRKCGVVCSIIQKEKSSSLFEKRPKLERKKN